MTCSRINSIREVSDTTVTARRLATSYFMMYTVKAIYEKSWPWKKTSQWKPNWKGFACDVCLAVRRRLAACLWPMVKIIECVRLPWQSVLSQAGSFFSKIIRIHGKCVAMCSIYGDNRRSTAGVLQFACTITTTTILCLLWHSMVGPVASVHCPLFVIAKRAARHKSVYNCCVSAARHSDCHCRHIATQQLQ